MFWRAVRQRKNCSLAAANIRARLDALLVRERLLGNRHPKFRANSAAFRFRVRQVFRTARREPIRAPANTRAGCNRF